MIFQQTIGKNCTFFMGKRENSGLVALSCNHEFEILLTSVMIIIALRVIYDNKYFRLKQGTYFFVGTHTPKLKLLFTPPLQICYLFCSVDKKNRARYVGCEHNFCSIVASSLRSLVIIYQISQVSSLRIKAIS